MQSELKIPKNRMIVTIIITIIIMLGAAAGCFFYFFHTVLRSFVNDCDKINAETESISVIARQAVDQDVKNLALYSRLLLSEKREEENEILDFLSILEEQSDFAAIGLLLENGALISQEPQIFEELSDQAFSMIATEQSLCFADPESLYVIYKQPLYEEGKKTATLLALRNSALEEDAFSRGLRLENSILYILNEEKEVVFYRGGAGKSFSYEAIYDDHIYKEQGTYKNYFDMARAVIIRIGPINKETAPRGSLFKNGTEIINSLLKRGSYIWYEKPFQTAEAGTFSVMIGKQAMVSKETVDSIIDVFILMAFILGAFVLLTIAVLWSQGISNRKLIKVAYLDLVISGPNWNRFKLDALRTLRKRRRRRKKFVMVSFDIKKFRVISDLDGHRKGEAILRQIAEILRKQMRREEYFARFAVDEFAMLLYYDTQEELTRRIYDIDEKFKEKIRIKGLNFDYGLFYIEDNRLSVNRMYTYANIAKDASSENHENRIAIFNEAMHGGIIREQEIESNMESALENGEFLVYLQPKYSVDGKSVDGAEALVRWNSPTLGFVSPGEFIPLFEQNGFIIKLDRYMLSNICAFQKKWMEKGKRMITISVNLSRAHFLDPNLAQYLEETIDSYRLPHQCIELEITESAFFDDKNTLLYTVKQLRSGGFKVSMDDFGSGYSSLNSLKDLQLDVIKLDGEFFRDTENVERSKTVIRDTIKMIKNLNMEVVAEGIETEEQVQFLQETGCDLIQGFYFAKPMPVQDFEALMQYETV